MTRWLLLLFVCVLPLQFAWSASAVYCKHESAPAASHFGHHAHVHQGADGQKAAGLEDPVGAAVQLAHFDCSYCHASAAQLPVGLLSLPEAPYDRSVPPHPRQLYAFCTEPDIDRPKWMRAS